MPAVGSDPAGRQTRPTSTGGASPGPGCAVLITGCSSGIGRATAQHLAGRGFTVYATARKIEAIRDLEAAGCRTLSLDVRDERSMRAAVATVEDAEGAVGVLINNAGYAQSGAIEAIPLEAVRSEFETNVLGYVQMSRFVLPGMRRQGWGRIVNLSSVAGRVTMPGAGFYAASKYAIEALSDALRFEVAGFGICVSLIEPGPIRTNFTEVANGELGHDSADGAYAAYHAAIAKADKETDSSALAGSPQQVARTIERAIRARRPRSRYRVTLVSRLLPVLHRMLGDRGFDRFLRTQATPPGAPSS